MVSTTSAPETSEVESQCGIGVHAASSIASIAARIFLSCRAVTENRTFSIFAVASTTPEWKAEWARTGEMPGWVAPDLGVTEHCALLAAVVDLHDRGVQVDRQRWSSPPAAPARSTAVSSMQSPPASIDPITLNAFVPLLAPCRAGPGAAGGLPAGLGSSKLTATR